MPMTLTIRLTPEKEARLKALAAREGRTAEEIAGEAIERLLQETTTPADAWEARLRGFVNNLPLPAAPLPADALRRTAMYDERP
jgi:hypothetical protein